MASKRPQAANTTPESTAVVVRHNKLIESKHFLSLPERRFVLWIVSQIKPEDADFHLYRMSVVDFIRFAGLEQSDEYYSRIVEMAMAKIFGDKYARLKPFDWIGGRSGDAVRFAGRLLRRRRSGRRWERSRKGNHRRSNGADTV